MSLIILGAGFACLVAWIAKVAEARGRFALGWAMAGTLIGVAAYGAGVTLLSIAVNRDASDSVTVLAMFTPTVFLIASMTAVALGLQRIPIKTSSRQHYPVEEITPRTSGGRGSFALKGDMVHIELTTGARVIPVAALRTMQADGECLRLLWEAGGETREALLLPRGKPDTAEGRRQQSRVLEQRLRERMGGSGSGEDAAAGSRYTGTR
jgi:hypothetical protein